MKVNPVLLLVLFLTISVSHGQMLPNEKINSLSATRYSNYVKSFFKVDAEKIALINAKVIDGTGSPSRNGQNILILNEEIIKVGDKGSFEIPDGFKIIDLTGRTVIPGLVGTHNHMRLPQGAMLFTSPRLYLACGVTTIQTCGTGNPHEEIEISRSIKFGEQLGPQIINSSPYFTGSEGKSNFIRFTDEKMIRDTIRYWAGKGVKWFKVYRHTRPQDLEVIIDEAHKNDAKVTGHLCATTFQEAGKLGIDAIEHGFIHSFDHADGKENNTCSGNRDFRSDLDINSKPVKKAQQTLIEHNVALTSTLAIFEAQARGKADPRALKAMSPFHVTAYRDRRRRMIEKGDHWYFKEEWLKKSMQYDLMFYRAGGLLTAGPDPGLHNLPGFGDQKNYELFIEAGFTSEEAIHVMTSNGAKLLGRDNIGKIASGMLADLVVLNGDLEADPINIREVEIVFKKGKGYDPEKLLQSVKGHVGSETDNYMTYLGQRLPGAVPELFAQNFISLPEQHEFGSIFSKNNKEFFYGIDKEGKAEIGYTKLLDGVWTSPKTLISHDTFSFNDPMLSADEKRLYFISDMPSNEKGNKKDYDIWFIERNNDSWSAPTNAGSQINSPGNEYYVSFSNNGTLYFASDRNSVEGKINNFDIYSSEQKNGKFKEPLMLPGSINSKGYEADVFIAPNESYLIFCSVRKEGFGQGDLYISFRNDDGTWSKAKNMGKIVNNEFHQLCPFVSQDGKYLFFTSNQDIYWVTSDIIETFRP